MKVAEFEVIRRIGHGAYGKVYLARKGDPGGFRTYYALKRLRMEHAGEEAFEHYLLREARHGGLVNHPSLVRIHGVLRWQGEFVLVMDYVDGVTLRQVLAPRRATADAMPREVALEIAAEVLEALHYVHTLVDPEGQQSGFVHRDVKPGNIMLTAGGGLKLMDFGVARGDDADAATQAGELRGTIAYMAPEQALGRPAGPAADQFAAGLVLLEMLTGTPAWGDPHGPGMLSRVVQGDVSEGLVRLPATDPVGQVLMRMLMPDPADRFGDSGEAARALRELRALVPSPPVLPGFAAGEVQRVRAARQAVQDVPSWSGSEGDDSAGSSGTWSRQATPLPGPCDSGSSWGRPVQTLPLGQRPVSAMQVQAEARAWPGPAKAQEGAEDPGASIPGLSVGREAAPAPLAGGPTLRATVAWPGDERPDPADIGAAATVPLGSMAPAIPPGAVASALPPGTQAAGSGPTPWSERTLPWSGQAPPGGIPSPGGVPGVAPAAPGPAPFSATPAAPAPPAGPRPGGQIPAGAAAVPAGAASTLPPGASGFFARPAPGGGATGPSRGASSRPAAGSPRTRPGRLDVAGSPLLSAAVALAALALAGAAGGLTWATLREAGQPEQQADLIEEARAPSPGRVEPAPRDGTPAAPARQDGSGEGPAGTGQLPVGEDTSPQTADGRSSRAAGADGLAWTGDRDAHEGSVAPRAIERVTLPASATPDAGRPGQGGHDMPPAAAPDEPLRDGMVLGEAQPSRESPGIELRPVEDRRSSAEQAEAVRNPRLGLPAETTPTPAPAPAGPQLRFLSSLVQPLAAPLSLRVRADGFLASSVQVYYQWRSEGRSGRRMRALRPQPDGSFALEIPASELRADRLQIWFVAEPGGVVAGSEGRPIEVKFQ